MSNREQVLIEQIREASEAYYTTGKSKLSDREFDALVEELEQINPNAEIFNKREIHGDDWNYQLETLPYKLYSIKKVKTWKDIQNWLIFIQNKIQSFKDFDIVLKNGSNSPYSENLFIKNWDSIFSVKDMDNAFILRGVRFGMTYINSTPSSSNIITVQNMICPQNGCKQFIFEPDSTHTQNTIDFLKLNNVDVDVNRKMITYGIINEANRVNVWTGMDGSPFDIDYSIFSLQSTTTDLSQPIFQIPSGISKYRIYIWLEGQDADIIKFSSPGYKFNFNLSFEKER